MFKTKKEFETDFKECFDLKQSKYKLENFEEIEKDADRYIQRIDISIRVICGFEIKDLEKKGYKVQGIFAFRNSKTKENRIMIMLQNFR